MSAVPRFGSRNRNTSSDTNKSGDRDDDQRRPPAKSGADQSAEPDTETGAAEQHHLLDREGLASLVGRVVVADVAGGRRLGDGLPESERRSHRDEHRKADRRGAARRQDRPADDRFADGLLAVPAIREITGRDGDQTVEQQRQRQQHADGEVADVEVGLQLRDETSDDVLVGLVHEEDQTQDPHRLREQAHEERHLGDGHGVSRGLVAPH
jgi:hypothetical protein